MDLFREILLDVWREACRHIEIAESTATIAQMLVKHMPVGQVLVRQFDEERGCIDTVAGGLAREDLDMPEVRTGCPAGPMKALLAWWGAGCIAHSRDLPGLGALLCPISPVPLERDVLAGPLGKVGSPGVLVLVAVAGEAFTAEHEAMMGVLLDPFSAALENDRRLREMAALREAAEADKQSLLTRLGRKDLGDTIVGAESGLRSVMERVELVARSDVPVLILGETGTGKELVSRAIHRRSLRHSGPVIRVSCGAIPPELIDSQLFGHERGAFTGAVRPRQGWFERADGGTLFLDEIGELPLDAQVRLLRILQDGWLERVGGHHPIKVNVRVVAATHRDLAGMVNERSFREDLWYRIAVFPILLPPLRDRVEDIPALARHFAQKAAQRFGLPLVMPEEEDFKLLTAYSWPGNIRELGSVIERAALLGNGERLEVAQALGIPGPGPRLGAATPPRARRTEAASRVLQSLDEAMRQHIEQALRQTRGRIDGPHGAAVLLEINPHTLRARMRKLGIDWRRFRSGP